MENDYFLIALVYGSLFLPKFLLEVHLYVFVFPDSFRFLIEVSMELLLLLLIENYQILLLLLL